MMASSGSGDSHAREIAAGLVAAVRGAIASKRRPDAAQVSSLAWVAAEDIADLLELPGLASLLAACRVVDPGDPATL